MSNENLALGLVPINMPYGNVRVRRYKADGTQNTENIFIGDAVVLDTTGTVLRATGGDGNYLMGAAVGLQDADETPIAYLTSSTEGYVFVADDPDQQFLIQEDGDSSDLATTDVGSNVSLVTAAGSTFRNRSGDMLDSSSVSTTADGQLRIIAKQDRVNNDVGAYCKWIVRINYHQQRPESGGDAI
jgi:hypothetical protein